MKDGPQWRAIPEEKGAIPGEKGAIPGEKGAIPGEKGAIPEEKGAIPGEVEGSTSKRHKNTNYQALMNITHLNQLWIRNWKFA